MTRTLLLLLALGILTSMPSDANPVYGWYIDDFEDGDLAEWMQAIPWDPIEAYISPLAAREGSYGLETNSPGMGWLYRDDQMAIVQPGYWVGCWTQLANVSWTRNYFGFGAHQYGTYSAVLGDNTNQLLIQYNPDWEYIELASVPFVFTNAYWYWVQVIWQPGGQITVNLMDSDMHTLLATVSTVHTAISSGGIALRSFGDYEYGYWDEIYAEELYTPIRPTSWGQIKAAFK